MLLFLWEAGNGFYTPSYRLCDIMPLSALSGCSSANATSCDLPRTQASVPLGNFVVLHACVFTRCYHLWSSRHSSKAQPVRFSPGHRRGNRTRRREAIFCRPAGGAGGANTNRVFQEPASPGAYSPVLHEKGENPVHVISKYIFSWF